MTVVRELMTSGCQCAGADDSIADVAGRLRDLDIGSMPIAGPGGTLAGMVTDRDIVVKVIAQRRNPDEVTAGELAAGEPVTVSADAPLEEAARLMRDNQIRRLPVLEDGKLVGMLAQADVARSAPVVQTGAVVAEVSQPG